MHTHHHQDVRVVYVCVCVKRITRKERKEKEVCSKIATRRVNVLKIGDEEEQKKKNFSSLLLVPTTGEIERDR